MKLGLAFDRGLLPMTAEECEKVWGSDWRERDHEEARKSLEDTWRREDSAVDERKALLEDMVHIQDAVDAKVQAGKGPANGELIREVLNELYGDDVPRRVMAAALRLLPSRDDPDSFDAI